MSERNPIQRQYAREAARYEQRWERYLDATVSRSLQALAARRGERILDAGCGTGLLLRRLSDQTAGVDGWGIDLSMEMLRTARRYGTPARLLLADLAHLPVERGSFDAVVSSSSLHHWSDPTAVLSQIRRALRPGGRLVLTDWANDHLPTRLLSHILRFTDPSHHRSFHSREMVRLLEQAGFLIRDRWFYRSGWRWGFVTFSAGVAGTPR
jgi:SAM-dependent methyltransferase